MKQLNKDTNILIVGLGLMGGSYARALSKKGYKITAISDKKESIEYGLKNGIIEKGFDCLNEKAIAEADIIIFALYPKIFIKWIEENHSLISDDAVITDISGVKESVIYRVQKILGDRVHFISSHPMAGRERSGVEYSDESVFNGANYIVVPTEKNTDEEISLCSKLGKELGFERISVLTPKDHDSIIGFLSQLTHCIAVSLMTCNDNKNLKEYTGDSFRDLTRIAKINEEMWSELFIMNKKELIHHMDKFISEFSYMKDMIEKENTDELKKLMRLSTERRSEFDK